MEQDHVVCFLRLLRIDKHNHIWLLLSAKDAKQQINILRLLLKTEDNRLSWLLFSAAPAQNTCKKSMLASGARLTRKRCGAARRGTARHVD
jgi:hypothetical protein